MQTVRLLSRALIGLLAAGALTPALLALERSKQDDTRVSGELARACSIDYDCGAADERCLQLKLDNRTTEQETALVTWQCNFAVGQATMEFSSENLGLLKNDDAPAADPGLGYRATFTGGQGSGFSLLPLQTAVTTRPTPTTPGISVQGYITLKLDPRTAPLFAGFYSDRITVTITPDGP